MRACWAAELLSAPPVAEGVAACSNRAPYPHGALWKCPAWGRPVNVALNLEVGEAGAPSPLAMRSSGLCGVRSAARVNAGDRVEGYSA